MAEAIKHGLDTLDSELVAFINSVFTALQEDNNIVRNYFMPGSISLYGKLNVLSWLQKRYIARRYI
jgi:hypothetical protein